MDINLDKSEHIAYNHKHSYSKNTNLNELITGQSEEYITKSMLYLNEKFNFEFKDIYILLTGLKKEVYKNVFNVSTEDYMKIYINFINMVSKYMNENNFKHEIFMYFYYNTKQICMIFNKGNHKEDEIDRCAKFVNNLLQNIYEMELFKGDKRYFNFTTITPLIRDYNGIATAFERIQELQELSFFNPESKVLSDEKLVKMKNNFSYSQSLQLLEDLNESITIGQEMKFKDTLLELFSQIKYCYNIKLCWDVLTELKKQAYRFNIIFDLKLDYEIGNQFELNVYSNIEEMFNTIEKIMNICMNGILEKGGRISYISQDAIKYIKSNYRKDISLNDIAAYVKVVPTYLSEIFNKEIGVSIPQYITNYRIEESKKLLTESNLKIHEVADIVGIKDANYFVKVFKKHEGTTPLKFKNKLKDNCDLNY